MAKIIVNKLKIKIIKLLLIHKIYSCHNMELQVDDWSWSSLTKTTMKSALYI